MLDTKYPLKFFNAGRKLDSVLKEAGIRDQFHAKFGTQFQRVRDYFLAHCHKVTIADVSAWVPELIADEIGEAV